MNGVWVQESSLNLNLNEIQYLNTLTFANTLDKKA